MLSIAEGPLYPELFSNLRTVQPLELELELELAFEFSKFFKRSERVFLRLKWQNLPGCGREWNGWKEQTILRGLNTISLYRVLFLIVHICFLNNF